MTKQEILEFLNANPACHLATIEDREPRVRGMGMYRADEDGIIFQSWTMKDVHKQLEKNPNVEICFNSKDAQVRVRGKMEIISDVELAKEVEQKRPFMTAVIEENGYECVGLYRLRNGKAHVWTFATNLDPKNFVDL